MLFYRKSPGQGMVEYSVIIALVLIAVLLVLGTLGGGASGLFNTVACHVNNTCASPSPSSSPPSGNHLVVEGGSGDGFVPVNAEEYFTVREFDASNNPVAPNSGYRGYTGDGASLTNSVADNTCVYDGGLGDFVCPSGGANASACPSDGFSNFVCAFSTTDTGGSHHTLTGTYGSDAPVALQVTVYTPGLPGASGGSLVISGPSTVTFPASGTYTVVAKDQHNNYLANVTTTSAFSITQTDTTGPTTVSDGTCIGGSGTSGSAPGNNVCSATTGDGTGATLHHTVTATFGVLSANLVTTFGSPVVTVIYLNTNDLGYSTSDYGVWPGIPGNLWSYGWQPNQTAEFGSAWYGNYLGQPPVYAYDQYSNPISVTASQFNFSVQITTDGGLSWTTENTCTSNQPPCYANVADPNDFYTMAPFTQSQFHRVVATYILTGVNSTTSGGYAPGYVDFYSPQIAEAMTHTATQIVNYLYFGGAPIDLNTYSGPVPVSMIAYDQVGKMLPTAPSDWTYTIERSAAGTSPFVPDGTCTSTTCTPLTPDPGDGSYHIIWPVYVGSVPPTTVETNGRAAFDATNNDTVQVNWRQTHFYYVP